MSRRPSSKPSSWTCSIGWGSAQAALTCSALAERVTAASTARSPLTVWVWTRCRSKQSVGRRTSVAPACRPSMAPWLGRRPRRVCSHHHLDLHAAGDGLRSIGRGDRADRWSAPREPDDRLRAGRVCPDGRDSQDRWRLF